MDARPGRIHLADAIFFRGLATNEELCFPADAGRVKARGRVPVIEHQNSAVKRLLDEEQLATQKPVPRSRIRQMALSRGYTLAEADDAIAFIELEEPYIRVLADGSIVDDVSTPPDADFWRRRNERRGKH